MPEQVEIKLAQRQTFDKLKKHGCLKDILDRLQIDSVLSEDKHRQLLAGFTPREILESWLEWNGIQGYTDVILQVISCLPHNELMQSCRLPRG